MNAITAIKAAPEPGFREGDITTMSVPIIRWPWQFGKPRVLGYERRQFEIMEVIAGPFGPRYIYAPVGRWRRALWWVTGRQ